MVLFFFAGGAGSEFDKALALLEPDGVGVRFGSGDVDVDVDVDVELEVTPALLRELTGDGKAVVSGPGLSGNAIVGNDTPVDGAPGVNCRLENPLVPVVLELELVCDALEALRVVPDPEPDPVPD